MQRYANRYLLLMSVHTHCILTLYCAKIPRIDPTDELVLRDVLFGEGDANKSYVVLCHKEDSTHISSVVQDAHNDGTCTRRISIVGL